MVKQNLQLVGMFWLCAATSVQAAIKNPIVFVTQIPINVNTFTINGAFGNHLADMYAAGRGGDLWIRYPDGTLKNLTASAGYGQQRMQGKKAIQVRDPAVNWDGKKVIFSMAIGAPEQIYRQGNYRWQLYEVTGLAKNQKPVIRKVAKQPATYNNVSPTYGTDGKIIFVSDRPRGGLPHLYPQLDEYEGVATNTGLWSLNPTNGRLHMLTHAPSGDFNPFVDSYGRVIFTRWDHLVQDKQASADRNGRQAFGTFNYASEAANAAKLNNRVEFFPEPLKNDTISLTGLNITGHEFNHFFPWQVNQDGTDLKSVNHIGRHELGGTFVDKVFNDDPALTSFIGNDQTREILNMFQIKQDPTNPNTFIGTNAEEFDTHASGQIVRLTNVAPGHNAEEMKIMYLTHKNTLTIVPEGGKVPTGHSGHYRDPLILSDSTLLAAHTFETRRDKNEGQRAAPKARYAFRLRSLKKLPNGTWTADKPLTKGIKKNISYYDPDVLVKYSGELWELQPVELKATAKPVALKPMLHKPEQQILKEQGITEASLRNYLKTKNLALIVVRNVTRRDRSDKQQPFNLAVTGTKTQAVTGKGKIYQVSHFQVFQADQLRGWNEYDKPKTRPGRRVLAQPLHNVILNPPLTPGAPKGSVKIAKDGSVALLVPTQRAVTWQLTDKKGNFVVRERNWLSMQPGEIRMCTSCHGINKLDQLGQKDPQNKPLALKELLVYLKSKGLK